MKLLYPFTKIKVMGGVLLLTAILGFMAMKNPATQVPPKYHVIGYVVGRNGLNTDMLDAKKLTHINYAFVGVKDNLAKLNNAASDSVNFQKLNLLKLKNPDLKILISIGGGGTGSKYFSDANLTPERRQAFAASAVNIIRDHKLDGIDIDWEYPSVPASFWGNVYRSEDKQNFTFMFREIRRQLDALEKQTGKKLLLTTALGVEQRHVKNMELDKFEPYVDFINLMTYDFVGDSVARHHTNLYPSGFTNEYSAHRAVTEFMAAGIPAHKLIVGAAFYAHRVYTSSSEGSGLGQKYGPRPSGAVTPASGYTLLRDSVVNQKGFKRYWDDKAKAPYLFNKDFKQFVSYDDEESIKHKCEYVKNRKLGGIMFWQYAADSKGNLLGVIDSVFAK